MPVLNQVFADVQDGYRIVAIHSPAEQHDEITPETYARPGHTIKVFYLPSSATPYGVQRPPDIVGGELTFYPPPCLDPELVSTYTPPVPDSVTGTQGQIALLKVGKLDQALAAIEAIADPMQKRIAQIKFNAGTWSRSDAVLIALAKGLGMKDADIDALFLSAENN